VSDDSDDAFDLDDYPSLIAGVRFVKSIQHVPWFVHAGRPFEPDLAELGLAYAEALGFPGIAVAAAAWADAAELAADPDLASPDIEGQLAGALAEEAAATVGPDNLEAALADAGNIVQTAVRDLAIQRAAQAGYDDEETLNAALEAAHGICQGALLVVLAVGEEDHPFARKYRLFERGRWPIGIIGETLHLL